ncbi:NAD-dependent epimerase/dehydratase family protein [Streptomyces sp. AJS327]|uniref:NAD(P)-dependent oxidoreductase n=1 Tax=Streptomyces sp. AJS327 TaxID=2545265 RepID=UPI0015E007CA|nr:NAD(P)H-binding protein [Streptomyces sp. AJS327]MBA0054068.1 NAD-dependent epimerase/dehydratase family protein [Streptomyces sp. AJS327]
MRCTVFGATGGTGTQLVRQALDAGHEVTAVVRDPGRLDVRHERLEIVTAEVTDDATLRPAVRGRDVALSALGATGNRTAGIASRGTRAILRALEAEGVPRYLGVSAVPVGPTPPGENPLFRVTLAPLVRRVFREVYADLAAMEAVIRESSVEWTIVRPPQLTDESLSGSYQRSMGGAVPRSHRIARADLAHAMLAMVDEAATVRQVVGVAA